MHFLNEIAVRVLSNFNDLHRVIHRETERVNFTIDAVPNFLA